MILLSLYSTPTTLVATRIEDDITDLADHLSTAVVRRMLAAGGHVTVSTL